MNLCTALRDIPGRKSALVGVFSTEEKARAACQDEEDEDAEVSGQPRTILAWKDGTAETPDGDSYVVILTGLDQRTGYSD